jgi:hypothetical protein
MLSFFGVWFICSIAGSGAGAALWGWKGAVAAYVVALAIGLPYLAERGWSHSHVHATGLGIGVGVLSLSTLWCFGPLPSAAIGLGLRWIKRR